MKGIQSFVALAALLATATFTTNVDAGCGCAAEPAACCAPAPVCCPPPPPVEVTFCAVDPVTCCKYPVSVCLPACCANEVPCYVGCRPGFFGRKILTYKFPGCGECVEVVITKFGRVIVR